MLINNLMLVTKGCWWNHVVTIHAIQFFKLTLIHLSYSSVIRKQLSTPLMPSKEERLMKTLCLNSQRGGMTMVLIGARGWTLHHQGFSTIRFTVWPATIYGTTLALILKVYVNSIPYFFMVCNCFLQLFFKNFKIFVFRVCQMLILMLWHI